MLHRELTVSDQRLKGRKISYLTYFSVYAVNDGYAGPVRLYSGPLQTVSYSVQGEGGFYVSVKYSGQD